METKANGNKVDFDYYLDGLVASQVEKKSNGTLVSQHAMEYSANGHRVKDTAKVQNADNHAAYLDNVFAYTFDPLDRIAKVEKKDAAGSTVLSTESYTHDPAGNVVAQTVKGISTSHSYDRNRLLTSTTDGSTASYTYDPFGRLSQVSSAGKVIQRNTYDGYDRIIKHRQLEDDGTTKTTTTSFDALDRTSSKVEGTKTTNFSYLGLSGEVLSEEVAGEITASYQYSPWGSRLSQVKFKPDGTAEDSYYGYNPHSDVETLTSDAGDTRSTYGYTAYGKNDDDRFTGVDKPEAQNPGKEPYNVYRFNAKRWDQSSESYDMGFRNYSPGLNRFLTRDSYNGALADLDLSTDPWNANRYAFAGGNPISRVEVDGHYNIDDEGNRVPTQPSSVSETPPPILPGSSDGPGTQKDLNRPYASEGVPWWEKLPGVASKDLGEQSKAAAIAVTAQLRGFDQASAMLTHWLSNTGDPYEFDVNQMLKEMPKFKKEIQFELGKLKGKGSFDSGWKLTDTGNEDPDWYFAVNNFQYRVSGRTGSDGKSQYWLQVYKRYNFGTEEEGRNDVVFPNKDFTLTRVHQPDWAHLHTVGLARDYDASGSGFFSE